MSAETTVDRLGAVPQSLLYLSFRSYPPPFSRYGRCEWFTPMYPSFSLAVTLFGSTTLLGGGNARGEADFDCIGVYMPPRAVEGRREEEYQSWTQRLREDLHAYSG